MPLHSHRKRVIGNLHRFRNAIRRGGRYFYRPRPDVVLRPDDEIIATGPDEGHALLAERCGFRLVEDEDTGEVELVTL